MLPRKKRKLQDAIYKMTTGTSEHEQEKKRRIEAEYKREKRRDKIKDISRICGIGFLILFVITLLFSTIICPAIFYDATETLFVTQNISDAQYAYILDGNPSMNIQYYTETRTLNDSQIIFHMMVSHCWNHEEKIKIWLNQSNFSYSEIKEVN